MSRPRTRATVSTSERGPDHRATIVRSAPSLAARGAILAIQVFRVVRLAVFPVKTCRFVPTCTEYALDALRLHGIVRGGTLALRRVVRCHPFHPGGIDPVPLVLP